MIFLFTYYAYIFDR